MPPRNKGHYADNGLFLEDAIKIVRKVEKEYTQYIGRGHNDWVSCNEKPPQDNEKWIGKDITDAEPRKFVVMIKGAKVPTTGYYHELYGWVKDFTGEYDDKNTGFANEVIAWRFLPEPPDPNIFVDKQAEEDFEEDMELD